MIAGAAAAANAYRQVRDWGASPTDLRLSLPGDHLVPDPGFVRTRAVCIDADRSVVWRWLMRAGRPVGGWLRGRWMGQYDGFNLAVAAADPPNALVLEHLGSGPPDVTWAFVIIEGPADGCRLLVRTRARARSGLLGSLRFVTFRWLDPVTVAAIRRLLLDVKYQAEAARLAETSRPD